jgi:hypothetical protein
VSPKRGDRVAPPARSGEYKLRFATNDAAKGWEELCCQAPGNTRAAFDTIWYLVDRDAREVRLVHAGPAHPKATDR